MLDAVPIFQFEEKIPAGRTVTLRRSRHFPLALAARMILASSSFAVFVALAIFEPSAVAAQIAIDFQPSNALGPVARCVVVVPGADAHPFAGGRQRVAEIDGRALGEAFQDGNDTSVGRAELVIDFIAVRGFAWWFSRSPIHRFRTGRLEAGD